MHYLVIVQRFDHFYVIALYKLNIIIIIIITVYVVCMYVLYVCSMYVRMYACTYVCMYVVCTYLHMYICMVCMHVHVCMYTHGGRGLTCTHVVGQTHREPDLPSLSQMAYDSHVVFSHPPSRDHIVNTIINYFHE